MKKTIIAFTTMFALSIAVAGGNGKMEEVKKAQTQSAPATPKEMPKVDKPKTKKEKLADCLTDKKLAKEECEKKFGPKKK